MSLFPHLEFHRTGIGLVPEAASKADSAIYVGHVPGSSRPLRSCTCAASRKSTCAHLRDLGKAVAEVQKVYAAIPWEQVFERSVWCRLARLCFHDHPQPCAAVEVSRVGYRGITILRVTSARGGELAQCFEEPSAQMRFLERMGKVPKGAGSFDRAGLLDRLALFQLTPQEVHFAKAGMKTNRQSWEESFWHRLAYHFVRESEGIPGAPRGTFHPAVEEETGDFTLTYRRPPTAGDPEGEPAVRISIPRERVPAVLELLAEEYPDQEDLQIRPVPLRTVFHVAEETVLEPEGVRPLIRALQEKGERRYLARLGPFRYGDLAYVRDLGILTELEKPGQERKFRSPAQLRLERCRVPAFLDELRALGVDSPDSLAAPLRDRPVHRSYDRIEIRSAGDDPDEALKRSWLWLAIEYGFGNQAISLAQILRARREGMPYLEIPGGMIDLNAPAFRHLDDLLDRMDGDLLDEDPEHPERNDPHERIRLAASDLLRLQAIAEVPIELPGEGTAAPLLDRLLNLRPAHTYQPPRGLTSPLRPYQVAGVDWLRFLVENRLGGLLCDDMGLGKTHQAMALMATLAEEGEIDAPCLVVCPTSVLSHWLGKIRQHARTLRVVVHHGPQRSLPGLLGRGDVLVTSYGVLRRDAAELQRFPFALAIFDEIQHVKNRGTQTYAAAAGLRAGVRLGLTGTPIENALGELKTLFDLVLPGYLGSDASFEERYGMLDEARRPELGAARTAEKLALLRRVISPFVLRRLKSSVLDELPAKIEDVRTCVLSEDQVKLYRDAVGGRGAELVSRILSRDEPLPYLHVFALLNLLKRICDHPALALNELDKAESYASGKWDLFREILDESLRSGQKVVVFSQYLGMIALMEKHLEGLGVGHVSLTGASVKRGEIVDRFNHDPACRVFLGSLKAGGTGIDLVGGSVVVHYDRWWNAAREDQATDRVYRLGQKRAVQVFKLITEGTLEEKIDALIDKKRQMMDNLVQADDPALAKVFTREELLDLLQPV